MLVQLSSVNVKQMLARPWYALCSSEIPESTAKVKGNLMMKFKLKVAVVACAVIAAGCSSFSSRNQSNTNNTEASTNAESADPFTEDKSRFISNSEGELNSIGTEINRLREQAAKQSNGEARQSAENLVRDLDLRLDETREELVDVKAASNADDFDSEKKDVELKLNALQEAYKQAKPQIH